MKLLASIPDLKFRPRSRAGRVFDRKLSNYIYPAARLLRG